MDKFTHLGLFEGIGGFSLAARWMGWETTAWCEWDKNCQRVLKYHFPNAIPHDDITKTDFTRYAGQIDILTGGFPCQPYSTAGKRLGKDDDRHLWPEMLRAIREIRPRWVVGENVRGLVSWNGGLVFDEVQTDLEAEGYEILPFILPACAVNAPHRRDRAWFVAFKKPGEIRQQWQSGSGNDVRVSDAANAEETRSESLQSRDKEAYSINGVFGGDGTTSNSNEIERCERRMHTNGPGQAERHIGTRDSRDGWGSWQDFPTQPPVCGGNDGIFRRLDGITFPKWREFAIGAYGNAIVPQVAHQIFKAIEQFYIINQTDND